MESVVGTRLSQRYGGWSALYCRGAPVGSEAPGGRALGADVDRLLSLAAPRCAASVTSRALAALRGVFWVLACERWQETPRSIKETRRCYFFSTQV